MSTKIPGGKATIAGAAIGSAAIAAALLFASKRRRNAPEPGKLPAIPSGEPPETD
jgi:LPXTG-motif cell wall-anchored protein